MSETDNDVHTPDLEAEKAEGASSEGANKGSRPRRSNSKRISMLERAAQEGEALLKELGYKEDAPDEGRRRTRSATRGPIVTPPNKRQKGANSRTSNNTPVTPPQPKGRKGRRKVQVDDSCETANGTTESVKSDDLDSNEMDSAEPVAEAVQDEKMDVDTEKSDGGSQEDKISASETCAEQSSPKKETNSTSQSQVTNGDVKSEEKSSTPESLPAKDSESVRASNDKPSSEQKMDVKEEDKKPSTDMTVASHAANTKPVVPSSVSIKPETVSQPNTPAVKPTPVQSNSPASESAIQTTVICPPKVSSPVSNEKGTEAVGSSPALSSSSLSVTPSGNTSNTPTIPTPIASSHTPTAPPAVHTPLPESVCGTTPVFSSVLHSVLPQSEVSTEQD